MQNRWSQTEIQMEVCIYLCLFHWSQQIPEKSVSITKYNYLLHLHYFQTYPSLISEMKNWLKHWVNNSLRVAIEEGQKFIFENVSLKNIKNGRCKLSFWKAMVNLWPFCLCPRSGPDFAIPRKWKYSRRPVYAQGLVNKGDIIFSVNWWSKNYNKCLMMSMSDISFRQNIAYILQPCQHFINLRITIIF